MLIIYFLLTHVYHMTPNTYSLDQLACHHLVRPDCYVMIDPAHSTFIVMFYCLLDITTLSCYPLNQAWYTWLYDYLICGNPALFYGTKCHMEQSATPHGGGHLLNLWGPPLESVGLLLLCSFSRKLIILNKLQLVWGMGGSDGCRNDTLLIVWGWHIVDYC